MLLWCCRLRMPCHTIIKPNYLYIVVSLSLCLCFWGTKRRRCGKCVEMTITLVGFNCGGSRNQYCGFCAPGDRACRKVGSMVRFVATQQIQDAIRDYNTRRELSGDKAGYIHPDSGSIEHLRLAHIASTLNLPLSQLLKGARIHIPPIEKPKPVAHSLVCR